MKLCPNCKTEYDDDSMFCNKDGTQLVLKDELKCPKCGRVFPMGTAFCSGCGTKLGMTADENAGFCTKCGMKLEAGWTVCPSCNNSLVNENNDNLCPENFDVDSATAEDAKIYAEKGYAGVQYLLALWYLAGEKGLEYDSERAAEWCKKSADQGFIYAQIRMGMLYEDGIGVEKNAKKSFDWYIKALNNPYFDVNDKYDNELLVRLGDMYHFGTNYIDQDKYEAFKYYKRACEADNPCCRALTGLGDCYLFGNGCNVNKREAFKLYKRACDDYEDDFIAKYRLGECYWFGNGTEVDAYEAVFLFDSACDLSKEENGPIHGQASYFLGLAHWDGIGCDENELLAKVEMIDAAINGSESAQEWCEEHDINWTAALEDDD